MPYKQFTYNRNDLYKQVWEKPVQEVAKLYGVSDVALAKACRKLAVPVPYRGYWARKASGQNPKQTPLPEVPPDFKSEVKVIRRYRNPVASSSLSSETRSKVSREKLPENAISVSPTLIEPHKLVTRAARILSRRKPSNDGLLRQGSEKCLDVEVSPVALDRALRVMDAFIKACELRKLTVINTGPAKYDQSGKQVSTENFEPDATQIQVEGEWITLRLIEKCRVESLPEPKPPKELTGYHLESWIRRNRPKPIYHPNGELQLIFKIADTQASWKDGKQQRLETCLNDAVARLFVLAQGVKDKRAERERWHQELEEDRRQKREQEQQEREEQERAQKFLSRLSNWQLAKDIRAYVTEITTIVDGEEVTLNPDGELAKELKWALFYADKIDPVTPLLDEIAEEKGLKNDVDGKGADD